MTGARKSTLSSLRLLDSWLPRCGHLGGGGTKFRLYGILRYLLSFPYTQKEEKQGIELKSVLSETADKEIRSP